MWSSHPLGLLLECGPASCVLIVLWAFLFRLSQTDPHSPLRGFALIIPPPPPLHHFPTLCPCSHPGPTFFSEIYPRSGSISFFSSSVSCYNSGTLPCTCSQYFPLGCGSSSDLELLEVEAGFSIRPVRISQASAWSGRPLLGSSPRFGICLLGAGLLCKNLLVPDCVEQKCQS